MKDKKISEAVKLLYKGAKMLPYHCPECDTPIFEYKGEMFCPSCGKKAVFEKDLKENLKDVAAETREETKETKIDELSKTSELEDSIRLKRLEDENKRTDECYDEYSLLLSALRKKLVDISNLLKTAKSPEEIDHLLNLTEKTLYMIEKIEKERI